MENKTTELVFILDRSGSMAGMEADTIGGFNSMIEKQKKEEGKAYVSTVLFSNDCRVLHDRVDVGEVKPLTEQDYTVSGSTALLDAIGGAIHHIGNIHKYARPEDVPGHTVFIITTDGMENASRNYTSERVKEMIARQRDKYGWEFVFVAADIDAVETGDRLGIRADRSFSYNKSKVGINNLYCCMSTVVSRVRNNEMLDETAFKDLTQKDEKNHK